MSLPLPTLLRLGVWLLPVTLGAGGGYLLGRQQASHHYQRLLAEQQADYQQQQALLDRQRAQQWQAAWQQQQRLHQQISQQENLLLAQQQRLKNQQQQQRQRIEHAVSQDSSAYTGLGADSLRLYRQFLGYPAAAVPAADALPAATSDQAPTTPAGLPAADLLAHAADYGAWCQELEQRLRTLTGLYSPPGDPP